MSKDKNTGKKAGKTAPERTLKEKRAAKAAKRANKGKITISNND